MKNLIFLFFSVFIAFSCNQNKWDKYVIISVKINDENIKKLQITNESDTIDIETISNGNFRDTFHIKGGYYNLAIGDSI